MRRIPPLKKGGNLHLYNPYRLIAAHSHRLRSEYNLIACTAALTRPFSVQRPAQIQIRTVESMNLHRCQRHRQPAAPAVAVLTSFWVQVLEKSITEPSAGRRRDRADEASAVEKPAVRSAPPHGGFNQDEIRRKLEDES